jgi:hypothetical protein
MRKLLWLMSSLLLSSANLYGQVDRGSLTGTVKDSSELVAPGATVTALRDATALTYIWFAPVAFHLPYHEHDSASKR